MPLISRARQSRAVTVTYGGVALVILLVVAVVALVVAPPAPPSVAEFAPQAADTIDESPDNQSSRFGAGDGACGEGQVCEGTTTTVPGDQDGDGVRDDRPERVIDITRVRRCVGDPPRQTEDPQSPPCVNYFEGDNGGATARGVTRDEIRIAVPDREGSPFEALLPHFNSRYELYGRHLRLVEVPEYDAPATAAYEASAFAAVSPSWDGHYDHDQGFRREASRLGIVSVTGSAGMATSEAEYRAAGPYAWTFRPLPDSLQRAVGELACSSLQGRLARFGGPAYRSTVRKFGIMVRPTDGAPMSTAVLRDRLARCDLSARVYEVRGAPSDTVPMQQMQADGVTSVLALASAYYVSNEMMAASKVGYQPEWIVAGTKTDDEFQWSGVAPPEQREHLLAIAPFNKLLPPDDEPYSWALRDGQADVDALSNVATVASAYHALLLLASGIQMAGPGLTAEQFARGLQSTRFPNPGHGAAPYYQAHVGFEPNDFAMVDDVAVTWWSAAAPSYRNVRGANDSRGGWCYVGRGRRFRPTAVPDVERALFDPDPAACR
jgi:hypothetical protein